MIGKYLKGEFCDPVTHDPFASTLLFAGDRLHKRAEIHAALRDGKFVIINRYVPSNIAYSVAKLRLQNRADEIPRFIKFNEQLEYVCFAFYLSKYLTGTNCWGCQSLIALYFWT